MYIYIYVYIYIYTQKLKYKSRTQAVRMNEASKPPKITQPDIKRRE